MKLKLIFSVMGNTQNIPYSYQYQVSKWIYKCVDLTDTDFAKNLHDIGYVSNADGTYRYKFFNFGNIYIPNGKYFHGDNGLHIKSKTVSIIVTFLCSKTAQCFVSGAFRNTDLCVCGYKNEPNFRLIKIEAINQNITDEELMFKPLSPIVISKPIFVGGKIVAEYISPLDVDYSDLFVENIIKKYEVAKNNGLVDDIDLSKKDFIFECISEPKSKLTSIKSENKSEETKVRGYLFKFKLKAPQNILQMITLTGVGSKNSMGFGAISVENI